MQKKPTISKEDIRAFQEAVKDAKPLVNDKTPLGSPPPVKRKPSQKNKAPERSFHFSETSYLPPVQGDDYLEFYQPGISHKILRNLRKGQYNVEAILDLHGKTVDEASVLLEAFLQHCLSHQVRVVLIIHGKGNPTITPILKNKLNHWLRETMTVLAFCSAAPKAGGRGALYVLLKRITEETEFE